MTRASPDHTHVGQWCHPCVEHGAAKMLEGVAEAEKVRRAEVPEPEWDPRVKGEPGTGRLTNNERRFAKKLPVVEVIWDDCLLFTGGWEAHADVMGQRRRIRQRSVGYILADDKRGIMLTASLSQGGNVFGTHVIPAAQIISRRKLR